MADTRVTNAENGRPISPDDIAVPKEAWRALWALVLGFFMILVDSTIVSVATPSLMRAFNAGIDTVVWVTSAYLLAFAVPMPNHPGR